MTVIELSVRLEPSFVNRARSDWTVDFSAPHSAAQPCKFFYHARRSCHDGTLDIPVNE